MRREAIRLLLMFAVHGLLLALMAWPMWDELRQLNNNPIGDWEP